MTINFASLCSWGCEPTSRQKMSFENKLLHTLHLHPNCSPRAWVFSKTARAQVCSATILKTFPRDDQKIIWLSKDTPALLAAVASASKFVISGEIDIPGLDESDLAPVSSRGDNRELRIRNLDAQSSNPISFGRNID